MGHGTTVMIQLIITSKPASWYLDLSYLFGPFISSSGGFFLSLVIGAIPGYCHRRHHILLATIVITIVHIVNDFMTIVILIVIIIIVVIGWRHGGVMPPRALAGGGGRTGAAAPAAPGACVNPISEGMLDTWL